METRTPLSGLDSVGYSRRRAQRRRIWGVLRRICLRIESLQQTEDARQACREVAEALEQARVQEGGRNTSAKKF